MFRYYFI